MLIMLNSMKTSHMMNPGDFAVGDNNKLYMLVELPERSDLMKYTFIDMETGKSVNGHANLIPFTHINSRIEIVQTYRSEEMVITDQLS